MNAEIIKTAQAAKEIFQKFRRRTDRIHSGVDDNRKKFFRTFTSNSININLKRKQHQLNQLQQAKQEANENIKIGQKAEIKSVRPGFGKYDLETGLSDAQKQKARSVRQSVDKFTETMKGIKERQERQQNLSPKSNILSI